MPTLFALLLFKVGDCHMLLGMAQGRPDLTHHEYFARVKGSRDGITKI